MLNNQLLGLTWMMSREICKSRLSPTVGLITVHMTPDPSLLVQILLSVKSVNSDPKFCYTLPFYDQNPYIGGSCRISYVILHHTVISIYIPLYPDDAWFHSHLLTCCLLNPPWKAAPILKIILWRFPPKYFRQIMLSKTKSAIIPARDPSVGGVGG